MKLGTFLKQPREDKDYDIDFSPWLNPMTDTLYDADITVECIDDPNDQAMIADRLLVSADTLKFWCKAGTSGLVYKVTVLVYTAGGRKDESEIYFAVEEL